MAIESLLETKALIMEFDGGIVDGKTKIISRTISRTNSLATDEKFYSTATTLAGLQEKSLMKVKKREITSMVNR